MADSKSSMEDVSGGTTLDMQVRSCWSWVWIPGLFLWVAFTITADSIRVECTENVHCGTGNTCPDNTNACVCADHEVFRPREYRCGANADLISNWADWVGLGTGIASLFTFIFLITLGTPKEEEEEKDEVEEATFTDIAVTLTALGLITLSAMLWISAVFWVPAHAKLGMSVSAIISFVLALTVFFYFPKSGDNAFLTKPNSKKSDGDFDTEAAERAVSRSRNRKGKI